MNVLYSKQFVNGVGVTDFRLFRMNVLHPKSGSTGFFATKRFAEFTSGIAESLHDPPKLVK